MMISHHKVVKIKYNKICKNAMEIKGNTMGYKLEYNDIKHSIQPLKL